MTHEEYKKMVEAYGGQVYGKSNQIEFINNDNKKNNNSLKVGINNLFFKFIEKTGADNLVSTVLPMKQNFDRNGTCLGLVLKIHRLLIEEKARKGKVTKEDVNKIASKIDNLDEEFIEEVKLLQDIYHENHSSVDINFHSNTLSLDMKSKRIFSSLKDEAKEIAEFIASHQVDSLVSIESRNHIMGYYNLGDDILVFYDPNQRLTIFDNKEKLQKFTQAYLMEIGKNNPNVGCNIYCHISANKFDEAIQPIRSLLQNPTDEALKKLAFKLIVSHASLQAVGFYNEEVDKMILYEDFIGQPLEQQKKMIANIYNKVSDLRYSSGTISTLEEWINFADNQLHNPPVEDAILFEKIKGLLVYFQAQLASDVQVFDDVKRQNSCINNLRS